MSRGAASGSVLSKDRREEDIIFSDPFPRSNHRQQSILLQQAKKGVLTVTNNGMASATVLEVSIRFEVPSDFLFLNLNHQLQKRLDGPWLLKPQAKLSFNLICYGRALGLHEAAVFFEFEGRPTCKLVVSLLGEDAISKSIEPSEPFVRPKRIKRSGNAVVVRGTRLPAPGYINRLDSYTLPDPLRALFIKRQVPPILLEELSAKNYKKYFSTLLFAEEYQLENDIEMYSMDSATMRASGAFVELRVPGLSEKQPSLVPGDAVYVTESGSEHEGVVHDVQGEAVFLKFNPGFHENFQAGNAYKVRFSLNRSGMRRAHQAIHFAAQLLDSFCFPKPAIAIDTPVPTIRKISMSLNQEQTTAVAEILNKKGAPPYIVFGPPGTGKTVTIVEAMLQVLRTKQNARVLACAPSNSSSDLLVERLSRFLKPAEMVRLNAFSIREKQVPDGVRPFCHFQRGEVVSSGALKGYKLVVCTYNHSSVLHGIDIQKGYFTHIFLDEAGQATEPETLIPIATLARPDTVVVLAGDHQQLGAVIKSSTASKHGLGRSLMERLISSPPYTSSPDVLEKSLATKLLRNYRSHPQILKVPSKLFYKDELIACAGKEAYSLYDWEPLPRQGFPVLFVGVDGKAEREGSSFSWFNAHEVSKVLELVQKLAQGGVKSSEIGIITPYNQQVKKIKKAISSSSPSLKDVKVGNVEVFQGREMQVTIISTVRSRKEMEEEDQTAALGFLDNPKRFNVAVTRARALLIVVGSPVVLEQDSHWKQLLQHCRDNRSYTGCELRTNWLQQLMSKLRAVVVSD